MDDLYRQYKGLLFRLAYQMTGSAADAEDVVQDVFVKAHHIHPESLAEPKAYLCKMTTNRCLDVLKSARKKREIYTGPWLPEPIPTSDADSFEAIEHKELLSYAMLVLLERLSPTERAVFVLREALCFEYTDIANLIGKNEANCRKLLSRAKGKMGFAHDEPIPNHGASEEWINRFLSALEQSNVETLLSLLSENVVLLSDGGGKVTAALHPITTRDHVARFLLGLVRRFSSAETGFQVKFMPLNGQIGLVIQVEGHVDTVVFLHIEQEAVRNIYFIRNPDKLLRLTSN